jgi:hypothetical protein
LGAGTRQIPPQHVLLLHPGQDKGVRFE